MKYFKQLDKDGNLQSIWKSADKKAIEQKLKHIEPERIIEIQDLEFNSLYEENYQSQYRFGSLI